MGLHYMPMYWGDYLRDTKHLSCEQHGAYLLLIAHCWNHGSIPIDKPRALARIVGTNTRQWNLNLAPAVLPFFRTDGTHGRVERERDLVQISRDKRRIFGRVGGMRTADKWRAKTVKSTKIGKPNLDVQSSKSPSNHNHIDNLPSNSRVREGTKIPKKRPAEKRPSDYSGKELEAMFAAKRQAKANSTAQPNPDDGGNN